MTGRSEKSNILIQILLQPLPHVLSIILYIYIYIYIYIYQYNIWRVYGDSRENLIKTVDIEHMEWADTGAGSEVFTLPFFCLFSKASYLALDLVLLSVVSCGV